MEIVQIERIKNYFVKFLLPSARKEWKNRNKYIFNDIDRPIIDKRVNLFWTGTYKGQITDHENLGDYLSLIIVNNLLQERGINFENEVDTTYYLYAIGSIIGWGYQDAVIWGSGLLNNKNALRCLRQKLDIRAVRGPRSREILLYYGIECPEIYGDPACLLPRYYYPKMKKKYQYSLILHHNSKLRKNKDVQQFMEENKIHYIEIMTTDYRRFVEEILQSDVVISSALHGIILAESYKVPTIFLREELNQDIKYEDWYFSTKRYNYKYITELKDIIFYNANCIPDIEDMQRKLIESFPYDLWCKNNV